MEVSMSALITIFGTILAAVVTAAVGIRSYRSQKATDRQVELRKQQRAAYEVYMQSYYDWTYTEDGTDEDEKAKDDYRQAYFKLFPIASDGFLRAAMAFHTYAWEAPYPDFAKEADRKKFEELWASLVVEMRNDANVESRQIKKSEIEAHIPWYWGSYESVQQPQVEQSVGQLSGGLDEEHVERVPVSSEASQAENREAKVVTPVVEDEVVEEDPAADTEFRTREDVVDDQEVMDEGERREEIDAAVEPPQRDH
jgi:hypothetical protein